LRKCGRKFFELFTKQCKSLRLFFIIISPCNFFTWQGGTPIDKFPKPMFRKHHAHFELLKVKVATIKLFHDSQGLHLKRRHFERKCYNKHTLKRLKALEEIFDLSCKLEKKNFYHLQIFFYTSLRFHLKLAIMRKTFFDTFETLHFQQLKDLSSTHLKLSMNQRTLFHTLSC